MADVQQQVCPECDGGPIEVYFTSRHRSVNPYDGSSNIIPAQHYIQCESCGWWWPVNGHGDVCQPPAFRTHVRPSQREDQG